ncbi:MAG: tetratricopeptide repeat protein [Candidatus Omnitrophica bacterium]|nr:tetratricopeptide repeat protein [Candidatus Omnitrophota bacterium]
MTFFRMLAFLTLFAGLMGQTLPALAAGEPQDSKDVEEAHRLVEAGKLDEALKLLDQVTLRSPAFAPAFFHRGMIFMQSQELDRSLSNFNKALALDAEFTQAYLGRSMVYFIQRDLDATVGDLDKALALDPELAVGYYNRGVARSYQQDFGRSFDDLSMAKKYGYPVEEELMQQVWGLGHTDSIVAEADAQILKNPEDGSAYYNRAVARYYRKEYETALADLNKAKTLGVQVEDAFVQELESTMAKTKPSPTPA